MMLIHITAEHDDVISSLLLSSLLPVLLPLLLLLTLKLIPKAINSNSSFALAFSSAEPNSRNGCNAAIFDSYSSAFPMVERMYFCELATASVVLLFILDHERFFPQPMIAQIK